MNRLTVTKKGIQFFNQQRQLPQNSRIQTSRLQTSRRSFSLPQLISQAPPTQRLTIPKSLSKLSLRLNDLKSKGLKKLMAEKEEEQLSKKMMEQFSDRKEYLKALVPLLIKKSRQGSQLGNIQSRLQRGRAYIDRLEHNFDNKFVFKIIKKQEQK